MKTVLGIILCAILLCAVAVPAAGQNAPPLSERVAATAMNSPWRDASKKETGLPAKWTYELGVVLKGLEGVWYSTGDGRYFKFVQRSIDHFVDKDVTIRSSPTVSWWPLRKSGRRKRSTSSRMRSASRCCQGHVCQK